MKKIFYFSGLALAFTAWQSCDKVDFPYQKNSTSSGPVTPNHIVEKRVLLEDYTGISCGTCPPAGDEAENLEALYGTKVVALTVHAGFLAIPSSPPLDYDFRTTVGTDYNTTFGISQNPTGMVNRADTAGSPLLSYSIWGARIASLLSSPQDVDIEIKNNFNSTSRQLNVTVISRFLNPMSGFYKLVVLMKEDSVIKAQKNDDPSFSPTFIENPYYHRHVLRGAINGNSTGWGDTLVVSSINAGDSIVKNYTFTVPSSYGNWTVVDSHCYVVAFLYDAGTTNGKQYEIVQAEEKKIK